MRAVATAAACCLLTVSLWAQTAHDPAKLLQEADRLAWLRAWNAAEPLYLEAERLFDAAGDKRNALYARVSALRGQLPRLPVPQVSARLADYLADPLVQSDERLRLRCLIVKADTDQDLDPALAGRSWREVLALSEKLGDEALANRARGELGLVAFLQGDVGVSVVALANALKVAQANGDVSSQARWLTLFGHGYVQLGRPAEALDFYDRALKVVAAVPDLPFPVMTHVGRSDALIKLGRLDEADDILEEAGTFAAKYNAHGYQAQLLTQRARIAEQRSQPDLTLRLLEEATKLAEAAGGGRLVAEIALDKAKILRERGQHAAAARTLHRGIRTARAMEERLLLPKLLAELADLRASQRRFADAAGHLDEAMKLLEGLFTTASSAWVQSRLVSGMDEVFLAGIRLEGLRGSDSARMFGAIERARARPLLELLVNRPLSEQTRPKDLQEAELRIASLQRRLLQSTDAAARQRLLDEIFTEEERLAPLAKPLFDRSRKHGARLTIGLRDLQRALRADEVLLEFALAEPSSYVLIVTTSSARLHSLPARDVIGQHVESLMTGVRAGEDVGERATSLADILIGPVTELGTKQRLLVSPDAELHHLPFELLAPSNRPRLLDSHVVSYTPSGSVLAVLRRPYRAPPRSVLALSASPSGTSVVPAAKAVARDIHDLDPTRLKPLPGADDEVRSVGATLGGESATVLIGDAGTEAAFKRQPLSEFQVLHFAAHGIPSSRFPSRAGLLLRPQGADDGMLQAREILMLPLNASLVTLSACDTGTGSIHGQDGASSLVRPFVAAGARAVVANLWAADDTFSLTLMRDFYRRLAGGADIATAMRDAKRHMVMTFGPEALPRLWSGVLVFGDGTGTVARSGAAASSQE